MQPPVLPVDAPRGDDRHRDVRNEVLAVVPQRSAPTGKRIFWRLALVLARFPTALRLLRRSR